jgi:phosphopantothenoylcysteine decarboxylase / phosphopantothenate---cysteine ligase
MKLRGKRIVLGVTGGIAAYKAAELLRLFENEGADVWVVMTRAATRFITPLTFRVLSGHPVLTTLYADETTLAEHADASGVEHIDLVKQADLVVIAPGTANAMAKAAWGLADDALSTIVLAAGADVLWAPAMNHRMWKNPVTQDNLTRLRRLAHHIVEPGEGWMACREHGVGRMADPGEILNQVVELIGHPQDLTGVRVLISAGRTEEPLDSVRVITNRSSGKMGVALAEEALDRGATVTLLAGLMDVVPPDRAQVVRAVTALDMSEKATRLFAETDVLIMAAAVGDFRAAEVAKTKIRRTDAELQVSLVSNPDILAGLARERRPDQILVGFALEPGSRTEAAQEKLAKKGVDLLVVNDGRALGSDTNEVMLLEAGGEPRPLPSLTKREVARKILDWVVKRRAHEGSTHRARRA